MATILPLLPLQQLVKLMHGLKMKHKAVKMTPINFHGKDVGDAVNDGENVLDANCLQSLSPSQSPSSSTNIISSLEAALNENNYDLLDLNSKEKKSVQSEY